MAVKPEYIVVFSTDLQEFISIVNEKKSDGFRCLGGISVTDTGGAILQFHQAMEK